MRELRLVGPSDDAVHIVVEADDERFLLLNDAALRAAARTQSAPPPAPVLAPPPARSELPVGPREIQMRVRAGESPEDIAAAHDIDVEKILRFAAPVLDERTRITDEARRARARRTATGAADGVVVQFGEAVDSRFTAHGILPYEVAWDSRRREDGEWVVTARWTGAGSEHAAEWLFHRATRTVSPLDDTSGDLLSDRPIRPLVPPPAPPEPRTSLLQAPPLAPGIVAFPPMPDAHTGPVPRVDHFFDQEAAAEGPRILPPLVPIAQVPAFDETPLPLGITDPTTRPGAAGTLRKLATPKRDESDEARAARARVPSWDDILLGVRRKD